MKLTRRSMFGVTAGAMAVATLPIAAALPVEAVVEEEPFEPHIYLDSKKLCELQREINARRSKCLQLLDAKVRLVAS